MYIVHYSVRLIVSTTLFIFCSWLFRKMSLSLIPGYESANVFLGSELVSTIWPKI